MSDYKVFLSFRGQDFSDSLCISLDVTTVREDKELGRDRLEAMNQSKISIPIFSKGYAFSIRCLQELAHIVECKEKSNQLVLPIFYDVSPNQVQEQSGSYEEAFKQHINCHDAKIIEMWRAALREVGALNGWELQHVADEHKDMLMRDVLSGVLEKPASKHEVGIEVHVEEVMKLLEINANDVRMVGIHGMAGIGKTTLAKVIYNQLKQHFAHHNFITTRETSLQNRGLEELQNPPLLGILRPYNSTEFEFASLDKGMNVLRHDEKVLMVVDDVEERDQLDALAFDNALLASGSRIIITTRKKEALDIYQVRGTYELNELQFSDALVLFYKHAFKGSTPAPRFMSLSCEIVLLIGGFPLALEVIGSFLDEKDEILWEYMLEELKKLPRNDVQSKLMIVCENLNDEVQEAFLDIACFFIGMHMGIVSYMFKDYSEDGRYYIEMLHLLSLVKVLDNGELWMHDQLRDVGREIARRQWHSLPDRRIRLWHSEEAVEVLNKKQNEDIYFSLNISMHSQYNHLDKFLPEEQDMEIIKAICLGIILREEQDMERIKAICLGTGSESYCFWSNQFTLLPNLEFLQLNKANIAGDFNLCLSNLKILRWHHCPNELLATNLCLKRILVLELLECDITNNWNGWNFIQMSINLEVLILKSCRRITKTPDFSAFPKLCRLILDDCTSLNYVDPSVGRLERLECLSVKGCSRLELLPPELTFLNDLGELYVDGTCLKGIPAFKDPVKLHCLSLKSCRSLRELPSSIGCFSLLEELDISHTSIHALPDSIGGLRELKLLNMSASNIEYLPRTFGKLEQVEVIDVSYCRNLHGEILLEPMRLYSLREFIMDGTNITLPPSISGLLRLRGLNRSGSGCHMLRAFDDSDDVVL